MPHIWILFLARNISFCILRSIYYLWLLFRFVVPFFPMSFRIKLRLMRFFGYVVFPIWLTTRRDRLLLRIRKRTCLCWLSHNLTRNNVLLIYLRNQQRIWFLVNIISFYWRNRTWIILSYSLTRFQQLFLF